MLAKIILPWFGGGAGSLCGISTLEEETGIANAIITPQLFERSQVVVHPGP